MTEQDLLTWALQHYFGEWEVEQAKQILDSKGMDAAVEHLRKSAADSCRSSCGPDMPSYDTRDGKVHLKAPETSLFDEPDLMYDIRWFARRKLESLSQLKLL